MKVTVGIPVYTQQDLVIRAIESIPKRPDVEILVVDDGSTDNTWKNLLHYRDTHDNVNLVLLYNEENKGVGYTVNKIYDNATGEYIVLLGSDDYIFADKFEKCLEMLDGTDLVYFDVIINNGEIWHLNDDKKTLLCGSYKFMRKDFIGDTRCPEVATAEDKPFYNELLEKNPTEKFSGVILKHYNHPRDGSLTDKVRKGILHE